MSFQRTPIVTCVDAGSSALLRQKLDDAGFIVFELDGETVADAVSFFAEAAKQLPLDPPLSGSVNWDALTDSLWNGIDELGEKEIAIVWPNVKRIVENDLIGFLMAIDCFKQVAISVYDVNSGVSQSIRLLIFLIDRGDSFKPLAK